MTARKLVAEGLGTALLVAAVVGSGIMADRLTGDVALALLANTIATGAALLVLITVFGPVSGAQFNPVVTLVFALRREIGVGLALGYVLAQVAGGLAGTEESGSGFGNVAKGHQVEVLLLGQGLAVVVRHELLADIRTPLTLSFFNSWHVCTGAEVQANPRFNVQIGMVGANVQP